MHVTSLSYRDIEEIIAKRGIMLAHETVRKWCLKFGQKYAKDLQYLPRVIIADKLAMYVAASRGLMPGVKHWQQKQLNNRAENLHQSTQQRERTMRRFKSPRQTQHFLSTFSIILPDGIRGIDGHLPDRIYYQEKMRLLR